MKTIILNSKSNIEDELISDDNASLISMKILYTIRKKIYLFDYDLK